MAMMRMKARSFNQTQWASQDEPQWAEKPVRRGVRAGQWDLRARKEAVVRKHWPDNLSLCAYDAAMRLRFLSTRSRWGGERSKSVWMKIDIFLFFLLARFKVASPSALSFSFLLSLSPFSRFARITSSMLVEVDRRLIISHGKRKRGRMPLPIIFFSPLFSFFLSRSFILPLYLSRLLSLEFVARGYKDKGSFSGTRGRRKRDEEEERRQRRVTQRK